MIERIEKAAVTSVARACGFATIAIVTFMIGFVHVPALCFKCGGILFLLLTAVLLLKATWARTQPYKSTEVWLLLPREERPTQETAQQLISGVLRNIYLTFAQHTAALAAGLLALAFTMQLFGVASRPL